MGDHDCFNCGTTDNVRWRESKKEYYCEECLQLN